MLRGYNVVWAYDTDTIGLFFFYIPDSIHGAHIFLLLLFYSRFRRVLISREGLLIERLLLLFSGISLSSIFLSGDLSFFGAVMRMSHGIMQFMAMAMRVWVFWAYLETEDAFEYILLTFLGCSAAFCV